MIQGDDIVCPWVEDDIPPLTLPPSSFAGQFDWKYFLTFNVFPVLIVFNLVFWVITAVSGRMFITRPALRQALQTFYVIITVLLLAILAFRIL
ncbi:MAG: hypothetical protein DI538_31235 [Azospira oryzae]|nr:MAG: hypothetical protein DI538_31235 [Azospira oryzae]